mmetsp:Transcript_54177/g.166718  ORF Transcript_54177/g.166718 Transcript_54177/m.166718 type:complete len:330 (+) Transcript_54177:253-1242(+)
MARGREAGFDRARAADGSGAVDFNRDREARVEDRLRLHEEREVACERALVVHRRAVRQVVARQARDDRHVARGVVIQIRRAADPDLHRPHADRRRAHARQTHRRTRPRPPHLWRHAAVAAVDSDRDRRGGAVVAVFHVGGSRREQMRVVDDRPLLTRRLGGWNRRQGAGSGGDTSRPFVIQGLAALEERRDAEVARVRARERRDVDARARHAVDPVQHGGVAAPRPGGARDRRRQDLVVDAAGAAREPGDGRLPARGGERGALIVPLHDLIPRVGRRRGGVRREAAVVGCGDRGGDRQKSRGDGSQGDGTHCDERLGRKQGVRPTSDTQ